MVSVGTLTTFECNRRKVFNNWQRSLAYVNLMKANLIHLFLWTSCEGIRFKFQLSLKLGVTVTENKN